jgi:O-antigen/teichoic acid export membrane protein
VARGVPAVLRQIGAVALGLGVLGLSSFAFLSIGGRALGPAAFAPLATMWVLVNALGPALFGPLEQEVGRAVAHRKALGEGGRPVYLKASLLALGIITASGAVLAAGSGVLTRLVFDGEGILVLALFVGLLGIGAENLTRGAMAGGDLFDRYGWQLALDGVLRLLGAVALFVAGVTLVGGYGFVLALAPVVAVIVTIRRLGAAMQPGPPAAWGDLTHAIGLLFAGSILSQLVVNAPPVAATVLAGPGEAARAGVFISVLVLARVPLFVFFSVQAAFLPGLAALVAHGDEAGFRRRLLMILGVVSALGATGLIAVATVGPWLVTLFYGADFQTTRADLIPLAVATWLFMIATVFAQTMVAVREYVPPLVGWALGTGAFFVALVAPLRLEQRIGLAFLVGTAVATLATGLALKARYATLFEPGHRLGEPEPAPPPSSA